MALPISIPNTFATETNNIPLSDLDANFTTVVNAINGIGSGLEPLANVAITGGTLTNVSIETGTANNLSISNVAITGGSIANVSPIAVVSGGTGANTAADARTSLSAAGSGANSDITSLSGLTTALSVPQGGTGLANVTANAVLIGGGVNAISTIAPSTSGNVLTSNGTSWESTPKITSGTAQASTSGTSIDFTGIPSWVKKITVMFAGVSTNGTSALQIQIGDSGGIETTGYTSAAQSGGSTNALTSGFSIAYAGFTATYTSTGAFVLNLMGSNTWIQSGTLYNFGSTTVSDSAGSKTLSDALTQVRITTVNGTDTFDAGSINILYE